MTDLQVKFQTLQETKRANLEQENLRARELGLKAQDVESQTQLRQAQLEKIYQAEIPNLMAEIEKINAQTELTKVQKETARAEALNAWINQQRNKNQLSVDPYGLILGPGNSSGAVAKVATTLISA